MWECTGLAQALAAGAEFRWGSHLLLWVCSFYCSAHTGKELPFFAFFLPQWDPHRAHPFRQKDGSSTGWAASVGQICILINSGVSNSLPSLFFFLHLYKWGRFGKAEVSKWTNAPIIRKSQSTHSTNKSLRKVFIGLNIETKFYFLKMTLHTSCKCTFRWENNE